MTAAARHGGTCACLALCAGLWLGLAGAARADQAVWPSAVLPRTASARVIYRLDRPVTGKGEIDLAWTDVEQRIVERRRIPFDLRDGTDIPFTIDPRRALTMQNYLQLHLAMSVLGADGKTAPRESSVVSSFVVSPPAATGWSDYPIIMWQTQNPHQYATLKTIGVSAGLMHADRNHPEAMLAEETTPLLQSDLPWYIENIATDFYSAYHRWTPDHPVDWRYAELLKRYAANPEDPAVYERAPSLSDETWLTRIATRLRQTVAAQRPYRPLFYNLADESGIADLAANWDFDFSAPSLAGFRQWLRGQYGTLAALNDEWGTQYRDWAEVRPATTREAMRAAGDNFAPWADFKAWMDVAYDAAIKRGRDAVHAADPTALAALEGAQLPGPGGYDYARLAHSVDVMEIYDAVQNVDMLRSFDPGMTLLTTSFSGPGEAHAVWYELLRGTRGLILWDDNHEFVHPDGTLGARGEALAPTFRTIRGGLGALLIASRRIADPVAILYSPASLRAQWMLDWRPRGDAWSESQQAQIDGPHSAQNAIDAYWKSFKKIGLEPQFVTPEMIEGGALRHGRYRILALPHAIALSAASERVLRGFIAAGGVVIADTEPGVFDEHARRRVASGLADLFPAAGTANPPSHGKIFDFRPKAEPDKGDTAALGVIAAAAGVKPVISVAGTDGQWPADVQSYLFQHGKVMIVGLIRVGGDPQADAERVSLTLPDRRFVYDLRQGKARPRGRALSLTLGPVAPELLAVSDAPPTPPALTGPARLAQGAAGLFRIRVAAAGFAVFHIDVKDPKGDIVPYYSGNLTAQAGAAEKPIQLALSDPAGRWTIEATNIATGAMATRRFEVVPAPRS